jgi:hypothetical protein
MESVIISAGAIVWLTIKVKEMQNQEGVYDALKTLTFKLMS